MSKPKIAPTTRNHDHTPIKPSVHAYLAAIGQRGGRSRSEAKRRTARENGKQVKETTI